MNGAEWFFLESGRQMGPVPLDQLVTLLKTRLPAGTLVWCDGMADWRKAEDVPDLASALAPEAAPPPPPRPTAPAPSRAASPSASPASPRAPSSSPRPTYRVPASASAPRAAVARPDDEPYTLNPFVLLPRCFRFGGRFDRGEFAVAYFSNTAIAIAIFLGIGIVGAGGASDTSNLIVGVVALILTPLFLGVALGSIIRRLHDLGQPGWYVLGMLVPCLGLLFLVYLLVAPGNANAPAPQASGGVSGVLIAVVVVFVGIFGIGIVAAIAIPSLLRARVSANEAAAIGDIRTMISAQATYQSMNGGFYEGHLGCLAKPDDCMANSTAPPFLDSAALAPTKSGYERVLVTGPAGRDLPAGLSPSSVTSFAYVARPVKAGQTGVRSFCGDSSGRICFDPQGGPNLVDKTNGEVVCSATCRDLY